MKPTRQTCSTAYRDQNPGTRPPTTAARCITRRQRLLELSHAPPQILDSQLRSQSHAPPRRPCRPPMYLAWEFGGHTTLHAPTHAVWVSVSLPCTCTRHHAPSTRRRIHVDVIRWRHTPSQQPCKHLHISPSPRQRQVIGWRQRLCCLTRDSTQTSIRWLWLFALTFDFRKGLSYSVFRVDSNFGFLFFTWSFEIGQLTHSSLWFLQRHSSQHLQVIFSCLSNLKPSSSFCLEFEGGC